MRSERRLRLIAVLVFLLAASIRANAAEMPQDLLVGRWSQIQGKEKATFEFTNNLKVKATIPDAMFAIEGTYRFINVNTLEMKLGLNPQAAPVKYRVSFNGDELTLHPEDSSAMKQVFKRLK
jgi:hypothetical protein